jgi:cell division protein ZipA
MSQLSQLQWALLIFGVAAAIAVYWFSRRDKRAMDSWSPNQEPEPLLPKPKDRQLDIFNGENQQFDEFGVGKPRRVAPRAEPLADPPAGAEPAPGPVAPSAAPAPRPVEEKIVSLLIAEREGTHIQGSLIHRALGEAGLAFGARSIYHRLQGEEAVFSVASLLKPGVLDPKLADSFSTPGLTLFMILPGPRQPLDALRDMLGTAERLARALNAEVFDSRRNLLSAQAARALTAEVEAWARQSMTPH